MSVVVVVDVKADVGGEGDGLMGDKFAKGGGGKGGGGNFILAMGEANGTDSSSEEEESPASMECDMKDISTEGEGRVNKQRRRERRFWIVTLWHERKARTTEQRWLVKRTKPRWTLMVSRSDT